MSASLIKMAETVAAVPKVVNHMLAFMAKYAAGPPGTSRWLIHINWPRSRVVPNPIEKNTTIKRLYAAKRKL